MAAKNDKNVEKQMGGCMAGFFNLFDRNHLLSGKRLYPKRLPPPVNDSSTELKTSICSPALSKECDKLKPPPPAKEQQEISEKDTTPANPPAPWKFNREAPRLSLDSRAVRDAKGGLRPREIRISTATTADDDESEYQRRSPSVIARLMGLEPLPSSATLSGSSEHNEPEKKAQLRRSTSESRSMDYYQFVDTPSFLSPVGNNNRSNDDNAGERKLDQSVAVVVDRRRQTEINSTRKSKNNTNNNGTKTRNQNRNNNNQRKFSVERRSYFDTADIFPPEVMVKQQPTPVTVYGEIERRLRMKGIEEPSKDLETLKHILDAMQLKGLLHSSSVAAKSRKNVVHDRSFLLREEESPIVLAKSTSTTRSTSPSSTARRRQHGAASSEPLVSPRRERTAKSPGRADNRSSSPVLRGKCGPLNVETQRRGNETPVQSPRTARRSDQTISRSPRYRKSTVEICRVNAVPCGGPVVTEDEMSTISGSSLSTSSYTDNEKWRVEEYRDGRNLLKRCDKLLNSIAEITTNSSSNSNSNSTELQQPSPVSVLDSSFYKEDESSPSPVKKRTIDFKDEAVVELDDEPWSPSLSSTRLLKLDNDIDSSDDSEFSYVSEVLRASNYFPDDSNLFLLLEKQKSSIRRSRRNKSKVSVLQRKLIFDTITEILNRNTHLPTWKAASVLGTRQIWAEFQKIRDHDLSEDLFEVVCGVLKKDMAGDSTNGWVGFPVEMSEAVLDIERMIFKDLIGEIIRDLACVGKENTRKQGHCRKLVF